MIRVLGLIVALLLGLALAGLWGGTVGHLRQLAGAERLPTWVAGLDPESGLRDGRGTLNGAALHWHRDGLGLALSLSGPDWQASGRARIDQAGLAIGDLDGLMPLGWLGAGDGVLAMQEGEIRLGPRGDLRSARIDGLVRGGQPEGPVTLVWDSGGWVLTAR